MNHTVIKSLNGVRILQREDGKYGIEDTHSGQISFRYRTLGMAESIAAEISAENDRIDTYEAETK